MRQSLGLSVPGASFSAPNLFAYTYRPDGLRSTLAVTTSAASGSFSWTYTSGGRELQEKDPFTGQPFPVPYNSQTYVPLSFTYDSYGRVQSETIPRSMTLPSATQNVAYDAEDQPITSTGLPGLTVRNEAFYRSYLANGASCSAIPGAGTTVPACTLDARSGTLRSWSSITNISGTMYTGSHTYTYDTAGRETNDVAACNPGFTYTSTRSYDTDNHTISQNYPQYYMTGFPCSDPAGTTYSGYTDSFSWDADGHLAEQNRAIPNDPLSQQFGWDGDDLLYSVYTNQVQINVEKLGYISNGTWGMYDRDWSGTVVNERTPTWISGAVQSQGRIYSCNSLPICATSFANGGPSNS